MKKVMILGNEGMVGHVIFSYLKSLNKYDLKGISRKEIDIEDSLPVLIELIGTTKQDVIINCIGILIKDSQENPAQAIFINSLFPHILENLDSKIIHLSTDCIFDGKSGPYNEQDWPTEKNWYGRSKALGEINNSKDLTLRTSVIGPELKGNGSGLFQWFMNQKEEINGYDNVIWTGITTLELAKQLDHVLNINLSGLYHLVPNISISKYDLLILIQDIWNKTDVKINRESTICQNKVLINNRIKEYDPNIPEYRIQLKELKTWIETNE